MKHILHKHLCPRGTTAMLSALLLLAAASAAYAGQVTVTRTYDTSAITLGTETAPDGTQFQSIGWPGLDCTAETGAPQLPVEYIRLMVPVYSNNFRVTLQSATGAYQLPLQSKVIAGQIPQATDGSPAPEFTYPDGDAYTAAEATARVVSHGYIDGCNHLVTVAVCPVAYDGATGATAYGSVTVRLDYDECTEAGLEGSRPLFPPHASPYVDVAGMVANTPDVARFRAARLPDATKGEYADWYYIIVPENLEQAVTDLALWKRQKGYNVVVKTIESILATSKYAVNSSVEIVDSVASLRAYLQDEFKSHGAFFCLLVGNDRTSMPIRKASFPQGETTYTEDKLSSGRCAVPTDAYFSDLSQHWNLRYEYEGAKIFTCPTSELSYNPDIYVGRLLCTQGYEIDNYLEKLVLYEANPGYGDNAYLANAFIAKSFCLKDNFKPVEIVLPKVFNNIIAPVDDGNNTYPTGAECIRLMKSTGFYTWKDHGHPYGLACSDKGGTFKKYYFTSIDDVISQHTLLEGFHPKLPSWFHEESGNGLDNLGNSTKPSIVYSNSCDNTPFDKLTWRYKENPDSLWIFDECYNMGESFTIGKGYGGPAFIGNTRARLTIYTPDIEAEFIRLIQEQTKIGVTLALSKLKYLSSGYMYMNHTQNLIGEPEFEMWLGKPKYLDWNSLKAYSTEWFPKAEAIGSTWTIWDGENNCFSYKCHGRTPIVAPELLSNDHLISVWKPGYLPLVHYNGINSTISGKSKKFIVRSATLGKSIDGSASSSKFSVGNEGRLNVRALDSITSSEKFEVESGGNVNLDCDQKVELNGSTVHTGGKMTVEAEKVTLGPGFKVEAGGTLTIKTK